MSWLKRNRPDNFAQMQELIATHKTPKEALRHIFETGEYTTIHMNVIQRLLILAYCEDNFIKIKVDLS